MGLLLSYLYLAVGLWAFPTTLDQDTCQNMFQCSIMMFHRTFSGFGVSDFFHLNFDVPSALVQATEDRSIWRFVFELSHMIVLGQVMVAAIFAVLLDGMQELRTEKVAALNDLSDRCFVCDLTSSCLEQAGITFGHHIQHVHSPQSYLYFLIYLRQKQYAECSALEQNLKDMIWCAPANKSLRSQWIPQRRTWRMKGKAEDSLSFESQLKQLQAQMRTMIETQDEVLSCVRGRQRD